MVRYLAISLAVLFVAGCGDAPVATGARHGVVSFGPQVTETIFALGEGPRVVAVTDFCDYPPEALKLAKVGGYMNPDFEKVTMLRPELVILSGKHLEMSAFCETSGIPFVNVYMDSLDTIDQGIETIGKALNVPEKAAALEAKVRGELSAVKASVADTPRPKVLIITGRSNHDLNSLATVSGKSFVSQVVSLAGGDNIYEDAGQPYLEASKETVVLKAPDVVIEFHAGENLSESEQDAYVRDWAQLPSLPAVKNGRVFVITEAHALRPGPRIPEIARKIAGMLHPAGAT